MKSTSHNITNIINGVECHSKAPRMLEPMPLPWERASLQAIMCCLGMHKSDTALHSEVHICRTVCSLVQVRPQAIHYQLDPEHFSCILSGQNVL